MANYNQNHLTDLNPQTLQPTQPGRGLAVAGLTLGLIGAVAVFFVCLGPLALLLGLAGFIFAFVAWRRPAVRAARRGMVIAGLAFSGFSLAAGIYETYVMYGPSGLLRRTYLTVNELKDRQFANSTQLLTEYNLWMDEYVAVLENMYPGQQNPVIMVEMMTYTFVFATWQEKQKQFEDEEGFNEKFTAITERATPHLKRISGQPNNPETVSPPDSLNPQ